MPGLRIPKSELVERTLIRKKLEKMLKEGEEPVRKPLRFQRFVRVAEERGINLGGLEGRAGAYKKMGLSYARALGMEAEYLKNFHPTWSEEEISRRAEGNLQNVYVGELKRNYRRKKG